MAGGIQNYLPPLLEKQLEKIVWLLTAIVNSSVTNTGNRILVQFVILMNTGELRAQLNRPPSLSFSFSLYLSSWLCSIFVVVAAAVVFSLVS